MKLRHAILGFLLLLMVALVTVLGLTVATETGLRQALVLADKVLPGSLTVAAVDGRLISPLRLDDLHYQAGELEFKLDEAVLKWRPRALLRGRLWVELLRADGVALRLPETPAETDTPAAEPFDLDEVPLPLQVTVDELRISDIRIWNPDAEQPFIIDEVALQAQTQERTLKVDRLYAQLPQGDLAVAGQLTLADTHPLAVNLEGNYNHSEYGPLALQGTLEGALQETVAMDLDISGFVTGAFDATASQLLQNPGWQGQLLFAVPELGEFSPELAGGTLTGELQSQGNIADFQASGELASTLPEVGPVQARFQVEGSDEAIRVQKLALEAVENPLAFSAQGKVDLANQTVAASGQWQALAWPLTGEAQISSPRGEFNLEGSLQDYALAATTTLSGPELGSLDARLDASGSDQAIEISEFALRAPEGNLALTASGRVNFADLTFQANGEWRSLAWPVVGEAQVASPEGSFEASGSFKDYQFNLTTQVGGTAVPEGSWQIQGNGSEQALEQVTLRAETLNGMLDGELSARWEPFLSWQADLSGEAINPGVQWPDLPGELSFDLQSQGEFAPAGRQATATLAELSGTLRGQPVQGEARLRLEEENLFIPTADLRAGDIRLNLSGKVADRWDLDWQLQAPELSQLLPTASGTISTTGSIVGPRLEPRANIDLDVQQLDFGATEIASLEGNADLDISGATRSQLSITGQELQVAGRVWQSLNLQGTGTPADHRLEAELLGNPERFRLALNGGWNEATELWRGTLTQLTLADTLVGTWDLAQPTPVQAGAQRAALEQGCLLSTPAELCVQGQWNASTGATGRVELEQLDVQRFFDLIPADVETDTQLSGVITGETKADGDPQGRIAVELSPGTLTVAADDAPVTVELDGGSLEARFDGIDATANLALAMGEIGRLRSAAQIVDVPGAARLDGELDARIEQLELISAFAPAVQDLSGQIIADLEFSGTLDAPAVGGAVRLQDGAVSIPELAVRIEEIALAAVSDGQGTLDLSGFARSGPGQLQLAGQLQPAVGELTVDLEGEDFQVAESADLQALISPDLNFTIEESQARLTGQVVVPEAYISPAGGGGGLSRVSTSDDVVLVSDEESVEPAAEEEGLPLYARVRLILGDEVRVEAFDFNGVLEGDLVVVQTPRLAAPQASGAIEVETGEYIIYGQQLQIERGRVMFSNSPLDNPSLDLRVTRTLDTAAAPATDDGTILVGAQVTGTARNPQLQLFSEPPMPDSTLLSYLTLGRAPDEAGDPALSIGRYLTPDLYVGYGIGLFDAVSTFILRYRLSKRLRLQASSSGEQSGADLFYTIDLR